MDLIQHEAAPYVLSEGGYGLLHGWVEALQTSGNVGQSGLFIFGIVQAVLVPVIETLSLPPEYVARRHVTASLDILLEENRETIPQLRRL